MLNLHELSVFFWQYCEVCHPSIFGQAIYDFIVWVEIFFKFLFLGAPSLGADRLGDNTEVEERLSGDQQNPG